MRAVAADPQVLDVILKDGSTLRLRPPAAADGPALLALFQGLSPESLHLRFHGYGEGWSDSAVRRYVRDAGHLLDDLNQLTRADVTTRNERRAAKFQALQDDLEERIARLAEQENLEALRPPLDGTQVMDRLGIAPGPEVGEALHFLLELRMERGPIPEGEAFALLDEWAKGRGTG